MNALSRKVILVALGLIFFNCTAAEYDPVANQVDYLKKELKLSDEQAAHVKQIISTAQQQAKEVRELNRGNFQAMEEAGQERRAQTDRQIEMLLEADQKAKFEEILARRAEFDERTLRLADQLGLTDDQAEQIDRIHRESREKFEAMRESGGDRRAIMQEMRKFREESDKKVEAVLSDEQIKLYRKLQEERRDQMRERGDREGRGGRDGQRRRQW